MRAKCFSQPKGTIRYLTQEQVTALFRAAADSPVRDRLILAFAYRFRMRTRELCDLPARAVDRKRWEVTITGAKNGRTRSYTIPRNLRRLVSAHKATGSTYFTSRQGPISRI